MRTKVDVQITVSRELVLKLLAAEIQNECARVGRRKLSKLNEPYRAMGDRLVNEALHLIP